MRQYEDKDYQTNDNNQAHIDEQCLALAELLHGTIAHGVTYLIIRLTESPYSPEKYQHIQEPYEEDIDWMRADYHPYWLLAEECRI